MSTALWATLGFFLAVLVGGTVWVGLSGFQAWRRTRRVPDRLLGRIDELSVEVAALERRSAELAGHSEVLQRNAAQLSGSLARLRILIAALQDVRQMAASVRAFVPSK